MALQADGIQALIVDDEAPARQRIYDLLNQDAEVRSLHEASDGETAVRMILSEKPNLVLLDVQMPELNGLEVIEAVGPENMPLTVLALRMTSTPSAPSKQMLWTTSSNLSAMSGSRRC